jgi:hypothetical protein
MAYNPATNSDWTTDAADRYGKDIVYALQSLINNMITSGNIASIIAALTAIQAQTLGINGGLTCYFLPASTTFSGANIYRIQILVDGTTCNTLTQGATNARTKQNLSAGTLYRNIILNPDIAYNSGTYDTCQFDQPVMLYLAASL